MTQQILLERPEIPNDPQGRRVTKSVIEFDEQEELFLLYSLGCENGPGINRDGKSSPWMTNPNPKYRGYPTTDPDIQRFGTYFINSVTQQNDIQKLQSRIKNIPSNPTNNQLLQELNDLLVSNEKQRNYVKEFNATYTDYEITAIQGIGDLTMNLWNVAYVNNEITGEPKILHLFNEPIHDRLYTCLVKWIDGRQPNLEITNVTFDRYIYNQDINSPEVVKIDGKPVADKIEFAVYGQQVIRPSYNNPAISEIFHPREIAHQFPDIRHFLQLPNLNPNHQFANLPGDNGRPRYYFGRQQWDDIWFGEAELLDSRNLRRAAIVDSIELSSLYSGLGVSEEQIEAALSEASYSKVTNPNQPLQYDLIPAYQDAPTDSNRAEWRFVPEDKTLVEIRLRENRYPCTLIGLNDKGRLYMLAWHGVYSKFPGWTIRQAAYKLQQYSATAILCDEGNDVFQYFRQNNLVPVIEPKRGQVRAVFIVARKKKGNTKSNENAGE